MPALLNTDLLSTAGTEPGCRFLAEGYLPLPDLLTPDGLDVLRGEARALEAAAQRRDFEMGCMDDSPRHMTTLGGHVIAEKSDLIPGLYQDPRLRQLLRRISGQDITTVPDLLERHVLNILHRVGDTHGAHTDDHPYALVIFLEAPEDPADGGLAHFAPGADSLHDLDTGQARTAHHRAGDAYLLRSDTTAHRVTPHARPGLRRTVLNFAYTTPAAHPLSTPSAAELYG
ncbi:hypothetical protein [Streptomyces sp. NPDC091371]|uniref:HalD/BesD family halogenase n=1 Tax=Streptomyces sp. NPDC091371 TaxID=3155303 RepID=UPI00344AD7C7